ncbi:hypothetical protein DPMN_161321 [Dreissena polymorpha]|uniref:Uncharacterized protein n=1 Tax=Dreissena polymorpha TaxID=45954 RepID=A0A9D4EMH4_DREPO|nr:hypothetical protein DPMN_161321 [Dreissena polymorpha]
MESEETSCPGSRTSSPAEKCVWSSTGRNHTKFQWDPDFLKGQCLDRCYFCVT